MEDDESNYEYEDNQNEAGDDDALDQDSVNEGKK